MATMSPASTMAPPNGDCAFFDKVPREIRDEIYKLVYHNSEPIMIVNKDMYKRICQQKQPDISATWAESLAYWHCVPESSATYSYKFLISKQWETEAIAAYAEANTFIVSHHTVLPAFLGNPAIRSSIRKIDIPRTFDHYMPWDYKRDYELSIGEYLTGCPKLDIGVGGLYYCAPILGELITHCHGTEEGAKYRSGWPSNEDLHVRNDPSLMRLEVVMLRRLDLCLDGTVMEDSEAMDALRKWCYGKFVDFLVGKFEDFV